MDEQKLEDLPEIKGMTLEPYEPDKESEWNWLQRMTAKFKAKLEAQEKKRKEKEWLATPEGQRWQSQEKERIEAEKRSAAIAEAAYEEETLECMMQLALECEAKGNLIKKHNIKPTDPRIEKIRYQLQQLKHAVSTTSYRG
jgi:hypothetical protein